MEKDDNRSPVRSHDETKTFSGSTKTTAIPTGPPKPRNNTEIKEASAQNEKLKMLEALQLKEAYRHDIFWMFNKINDPHDEMNIGYLMKLRDFIQDNSILVITGSKMMSTPTSAVPNTNRQQGRFGESLAHHIAPHHQMYHHQQQRHYYTPRPVQHYQHQNSHEFTECRFSVIGGHHMLMCSILKACEYYEKALALCGGDPTLVHPGHWQWTPQQTITMFCQEQCLKCEHMYVEPIEVRNARYKHLLLFPESLIEQALVRSATSTPFSSTPHHGQHNRTVAQQPQKYVDDAAATTTTVVHNTESS